MPRTTTQFFVPPSTYDAAPRPVSAHGTTIRYSDGTTRLDGIAGLWNVPLGYGHRGVADAVHAALLDASYLTHFRATHAWADRAGSALLEVAGPRHYNRVLHSTSGSAALDSVVKLVRQYQLLRERTNHRRLIVALKGSYHGTTMGAMALTGEDLGQRAYAVDTRLVRHVDHQHPQELRDLLAREGDRVAAIVIEPVQGSGTVVVGEGFLAAVEEGRREHGYLVVADEVATGFGRTGRMFSSQGWSEQPDLLITSKGLTNGTQAASAVLMSQHVSQVLDESDSPFMHGETQAGAPAACAAILATIEAFREEGVLDRGAQVAARLDTALLDLAAQTGATTTGKGCFRSLVLPDLDGQDATELVSRCRRAGAVVQPGPSCIQLVPSLIYAEDQLDSLLDRVGNAVLEFASHRPARVA